MVGRRREEDVEREVGKVVGRCGERGEESCRKMRRVVVGRCGERGGEICRKVFEERLAIVRY